MKKIYLLALLCGAIVLVSFFLIISNQHLSQPFPSLTGEAVSVVTPDYIELKWQRQQGYEVLSQRVAIAKECVSENYFTGCDWLYYEFLEPDVLNFRDFNIAGEENELKFYQIISKIKVGEEGTACSPQCLFRPECFPSPTLTSTTVLCEDGDYAWYDVCTQERIKIATCSTEQQAYCCFQDTQEQGWYDTECEFFLVQDVYLPNYLIKYDQDCDNVVKICTEKSDIFVKFTQPFVGESTGDTIINWLVATKDTIVVPKMVEHGIKTSATHSLESASDLLETKAIDYVAYWDSKQQYYFGAAIGQAPGGTRIITGDFVLKQYNPYFIGARRDGEITWIGKIPERQTFELSFVPEYMGKETRNQNFIVLPFDTKIKTASQLCDLDFSGLPLNSDKAIYEWDAEKQQEIPAGTGVTCKDVATNDFNLKPGKVYKVFVTQDTIWEQV